MPVDFEVRIIEMFDKLDVKIDDLCDRQTRTETKLDDHFTQLENEKNEKKTKTDRNLYVKFSLFGIGIAIYEALRELFR